MDPIFGLILLAVMVAVILVAYSAVQNLQSRRVPSDQEMAEINAVLRESRRLLEDVAAWQKESKRLLEEMVGLQAQTNRLLEERTLSSKAASEKQT